MNNEIENTTIAEQAALDAKRKAEKLETMLTDATTALWTLVKNGENMREAFSDLTTDEWWSWERCEMLARRVGMRI